MTVPVRLTGAQRDAIQAQALDGLHSFDEVFLALEGEDFDAAKRLGRELADDLRLIDELGWDVESTEGEVELVLPAKDLRRIFTRLRCDAEGERRDEEKEEARARAEGQALRERAELVAAACKAVLSAVEEDAFERAGREAE